MFSKVFWFQCYMLLWGYLKSLPALRSHGTSSVKGVPTLMKYTPLKALTIIVLLKVSVFHFKRREEQGAFDTYIVLCESWYIGSYRLQPFEALLSSRALNHPTAHPIHCNHLKGILPAGTTVRGGNTVKRSLDCIMERSFTYLTKYQ